MSFQPRKEPSGATHARHSPTKRKPHCQRCHPLRFISVTNLQQKEDFNKSSDRIRPDVVRFMRVESLVDIANHSSTPFSMRFSAAIPLVFRKTVETFEHVLGSALGCMAATAAWLDETSAPQAFNTVHSSPQGQFILQYIILQLRLNVTSLLKPQNIQNYTTDSITNNHHRHHHRHHHRQLASPVQIHREHGFRLMRRYPDLSTTENATCDSIAYCVARACHCHDSQNHRGNWRALHCRRVR